MQLQNSNRRTTNAIQRRHTIFTSTRFCFRLGFVKKFGGKVEENSVGGKNRTKSQYKQTIFFFFQREFFNHFFLLIILISKIVSFDKMDNGEN